MADSSMAAVLKTVERQRSGGSNPSASAQCNASQVPHVSAAFVFDGLSVKRIMDSLKEKGFIARRNGKRDGWWEVLIEIPGAQ